MGRKASIHTLLDRVTEFGIIHYQTIPFGGFAMSTDTRSVFGDLSPSEKLQLVQDLWDDLAAAGRHKRLALMEQFAKNKQTNS